MDNPNRTWGAALGYLLIERLRALALQGTELATAQVDTLRIAAHGHGRGHVQHAAHPFVPGLQLALRAELALDNSAGNIALQTHPQSLKTMP